MRLIYMKHRHTHTQVLVHVNEGSSYKVPRQYVVIASHIIEDVKVPPALEGEIMTTKAGGYRLLEYEGDIVFSNEDVEDVEMDWFEEVVSGEESKADYYGSLAMDID